VLATVRLAERSLLHESPPATPLLNTPFSFEPGAWALFREHAILGRGSNAIVFYLTRPLQDKSTRVPGISLGDAAQIAIAEKELRFTRDHIQGVDILPQSP
jgi:hypothetical protein